MAGNKQKHWLMNATAGLLVLGTITPLEAAPRSGAESRTVAIDARTLPFVRNIDERYQSFQIGFSHLTGGETWKSYDDLPKDAAAASGFAAIREARAPTDLANPKLRTLTAALAPLYIRFSGTTANSVYFHDSDAPPPTAAPKGYTVLLTRQAWEGAVDFAKAVDAKIVTSFTNSEGVRDAAGVWTPRMAAPWLAHTRAIGGEIYAAELFNEPNAPEPPRIPKGHTAEEFSQSFAAFRSFMNSNATQTKLAGPGTARMGVGGIPSIEAVTSEMYASAQPTPRFDIVSYHYYPALAERCAPANSPQGISLDKALSEAWLARPDAELQRHKVLRDKYAPGAPIWLTETGGAACGGLRWQQTFLDAFRFADTHARLAKQGLDAIFTHALISGSNGIIDEKTLEPNASYWAALLWRRLMGSRVLDVQAPKAGLHLYAHCQRGSAGGVTLLAINLEASSARIRVDGGAEVYTLTASELQSKSVLLNGRPLAMGRGDTLPSINPVRSKAKQVALAPTSITFITLPRAANPNCQT